MRIESLLSPKNNNQQMEAYAFAERYVNNGSPSLEHRTVSKPYSPINGDTYFRLPYRPISPSKTVDILESNPDKASKAFIYDKDGNIRFFVHPDMTNPSDYSGNIDPITVFPTSSGRTVCVFEREKPLFIKLHYDGMLGRIVRKMERKEVTQAIEVSTELEKQQSKGAFPQAFGYMPETIGVVAQIGEKEIGYVVRELTVRGNLKSKDVPILIPWFTLFSTDRKSPNDPSLLEQWVKIMGQDSSLKASSNFLKDKFLFPAIESFCYLADRAGFIVDYNAQNFLVTPDSTSCPSAIVLRDMQSTWSDVAKRKERQLPAANFTRSMDAETHEDEEYLFKQRSLYFDHKFVEYVLMPIIYEFAKSFGANINTFIEESREYLLQRFPSIRDYFKPYDLSFRLPPGITQKDQSGRSILTIAPKSAFR